MTAGTADRTSPPHSDEAPFDQNNACNWLTDYEGLLGSSSETTSALEAMGHVIESLRNERYSEHNTKGNGDNGRSGFVRDCYYRIRPFMQHRIVGQVAFEGLGAGLYENVG